jgi:uncharacterized membrane protein
MSHYKLIQRNEPHLERETHQRIAWVVYLASVLFAGVLFWVSAGRWANYEYRTFDLAFYVQSLWLIARGDFGAGSILNVPLLGNHACVVMFPLVPLFALVSHPLLLIAVQAVALASMAPVGYRVARHLGLSPEASAVMALLLLITPATSYVGLHEFHSETFTAPFLLLALQALLMNRLGAYWFWFLATLLCKENMPFLLVTLSGLLALTHWRRGWRWLLLWTGLPSLVAAGWLILYLGVISPRLNGGNVDFRELYGHLLVPFTELPAAVWQQLAKSYDGSLFLGLILPFCGFALLRPLWLLVAAPILAQHYLSARPSEWQLYFHYAAPLIPLFWLASCEALAGISKSRRLVELSSRVRFRVDLAMAGVLAATSVLAHAWWSPYAEPQQKSSKAAAYLVAEHIAAIPPEASVVAGLPYLSHLAERREVYSLHHLLKGLKTLSWAEWEVPDPTDVVLVDYGDTATFDTRAGYYHPQMRHVGGAVYPSSDVLLHRFLSRAKWTAVSIDSLTVFYRTDGRASKSLSEGLRDSFSTRVNANHGANLRSEGFADSGPMESLKSISAQVAANGHLKLTTQWRFTEERKVIPWLKLRLEAVDGSHVEWLDRGLCVPQAPADGALWKDDWIAVLKDRIKSGEYKVQAVFLDKPLTQWYLVNAKGVETPLLMVIDLGVARVP